MTKPYRYQVEGVRAIRRANYRHLLADEMGLGKTVQALISMVISKSSPTIAVVPAPLKINWKREAVKHTNLRPAVLYGRKVLKFRKGIPHLIIINYDILKNWVPYLKTLNPEMIILDECQKISNSNTQQTKNVKLLCKDVPRLIALSGTPLTNQPSELFTVLKLLRPDIYPSFMTYAHKYCRAKKTFWGWQYKGAKNLDILHDELIDNNIMTRRRKKDVLKDLPPKSRIVLPFEISRRDEYLEAEQNFMSWLSKQSVHKAKKAAKAVQLVKMGYLKRLAVQLKFKSVRQWIDSFLAETDEKLIIFAIHKKPISVLKNRYSDMCVTLDGSTSHDKRQIGIDQFQNDKKTRVMIANMTVGGVGHNITAAHNLAFIELGWTPGGHLQCEDRAHRIGQMKKVLCYYLIAAGTIEEDLCSLLQKKQGNIEAVLDGGIQKDTLDIYRQLQKKIRERGLAV